MLLSPQTTAPSHKLIPLYLSINITDMYTHWHVSIPLDSQTFTINSIIPYNAHHRFSNLVFYQNHMGSLINIPNTPRPDPRLMNSEASEIV